MPATDDVVKIPGYIAGTWAADPVFSEVSFVSRHIMVANLRGRFTDFKIEIITGEDPLQSSVNATIQTASLTTNFEMRDGHLKSADYLGAEEHPEMVFRSTKVRPEGDGFVVDGDLTIHGVTKPVSLNLEVGGFQTGVPPFGDTRAGFAATTEIDRREFGIDINPVLDSGGFVVGNILKIALEIEAVLQT